MKKISVIIPIYNMAMYLEECLDSVVTQTLKEIEVICINDGSTDQSLKILERYASKYENIIILNQNNCGVGKSRNSGIKIAKGEFVAFMDPDDFYPENNILECMFNGATENDVLICGGSFSSFRGETEKKIIKEYYGWNRDLTFDVNRRMKYSEYQFSYGFTRFVYKLDFLKENNLYFPLYIRNQDPPFFVRAMICAGEFYAMEKITYCYRSSHKLNISSLNSTIDYAKGVLDLLRISRERRLNKLHSITVEVLHEDLTFAMYKYIAEDNLELQGIADKINEEIDIKLLQENNSKIEEPYLLKKFEIMTLLRKSKELKERFIHKLKKYNNISIFGAGKVGVILGEYLKSFEGINVTCFAVTDTTNNASNIYGMPVRSIKELVPYKDDILILIATYSNYHYEIRGTLEKLQFKKILVVDFKELQLFKMIADDE